MQWNRGLPSNDDLHVVFKRDNYEVLGGQFIVWDGYFVRVSLFQRPPKNKHGTWYEGYFDLPNVIAWMKLPDPPVIEESDDTT